MDKGCTPSQLIAQMFAYLREYWLRLGRIGQKVSGEWCWCCVVGF